MSVFIGWTEEDIKQELKQCYECICNSESTLEDKQSALDIISFAALASDVSQQLTDTSWMLFEDCHKRIHYIQSGSDAALKPSRHENPNACKNCGGTEYEGVGSGVGHHVYCSNCGQDFDDPSLNWF